MSKPLLHWIQHLPQPVFKQYLAIYLHQLSVQELEEEIMRLCPLWKVLDPAFLATSRSIDCAFVLFNWIYCDVHARGWTDVTLRATLPHPTLYASSC